MGLFSAREVNRPTRLLALASVAAACNQYPLVSNNYGFNKKWLLSRIQASNFGQNTDACNIHPQYLENSCRMCSLHSDQHRVSVRLNLST